MESFEIDPVVRLANETRRRGQMLVVTDRASWRVDYCGALNEIGMFRLFRRSKGQSDFQEQSQTFPGDPTGMRAVRAHIESQDVQGEPLASPPIHRSGRGRALRPFQQNLPTALAPDLLTDRRGYIEGVDSPNAASRIWNMRHKKAPVVRNAEHL